MIVTTCGAVCFLFTRDGGAGFLGGCAGACAFNEGAIVATHNNMLVNVATRLGMVTDIFLKNVSAFYQTPFGAYVFPVANARCEPKVIVGTKIVRTSP